MIDFLVFIDRLIFRYQNQNSGMYFGMGSPIYIHLYFFIESASLVLLTQQKSKPALDMVSLFFENILNCKQ